MLYHVFNHICQLGDKHVHSLECLISHQPRPVISIRLLRTSKTTVNSLLLIDQRKTHIRNHLARQIFSIKTLDAGH